MELEYASDETGHNTLLVQGATPAGILWMTIVPWQLLIDQGRWRIGNS
jgi:hypothetical protein